MNIRLSKESEVPIRRQLTEQIVFLIATEMLKPGEALPSVRRLARRHVLREVLLPSGDLKSLRAADLVFADTIARPQVKHPAAVHYRLVADSSLKYLTDAMNSYQSVSGDRLRRWGE